MVYMLYNGVCVILWCVLYYGVYVILWCVCYIMLCILYNGCMLHTGMNVIYIKLYIMLYNVV